MDPRTIDNEWFVIAADIFVNLAGAWYAAALIAPVFSESPISAINLDLLLVNLAFGTLSAMIAFRLRKLTKL
jgi:hypothetical protein